MKKLEKMGLILLGIYALICGILFFIQESLLMFPSKLEANHQYGFANEFEEFDIEVEKGITINTIHFKSKEQKGLVFFLHGNAGDLDGWGQGASLYTNNGYDVFYMDYRGYGKSSGKVKSEKQLVKDAQIVYDYLKAKFPENKIIVSGTSLGTGIAAQIAANNQPAKLLLNAPYFSLQSLIREKVFPFPIPGPIIKYALKTNKYLAAVKCPIFIFHGSNDVVIPPKHSQKLQALYPNIERFILKGYGHNDLPLSKEFQLKMKEILK